MKVRTLIEKMKVEAGETAGLTPGPPTGKVGVPPSKGLLPPVLPREVPASRAKLEKLEAIRKKVEKKLEKVRRMGEHFRQLAEEETEAEERLTKVLFGEVSRKLFGRDPSEDPEEVCKQIEKIELESLNVEVFVRDLLEAPGLRAIGESEP